MRALLRPTCLALALAWGPAAPALAAPGPLVAAPPTAPPLPRPEAIALDVLAPAAASAVMLSLLGPNGGNSIVSYAVLAGAVAGPPAALVGWRERPFAWDSYFASFSGGILGLAVGYGVTSLAFPTVVEAAANAVPVKGANPFAKLALLALGQGLGAAGGYLAYRQARPWLSGLDKLPEHRTDDPNNWDRWKERHHNE